MTLGELRAVLAEIADENEANADREVLIRVGPREYESIPWGNVGLVMTSANERANVVVDLVAGR